MKKTKMSQQLLAKTRLVVDLTTVSIWNSCQEWTHRNCITCLSPSSWMAMRARQPNKEASVLHRRITNTIWGLKERDQVWTLTTQLRKICSVFIPVGFLIFQMKIMKLASCYHQLKLQRMQQWEGKTTQELSNNCLIHWISLPFLIQWTQSRFVAINSNPIRMKLVKPQEQNRHSKRTIA